MRVSPSVRIVTAKELVFISDSLSLTGLTEGVYCHSNNLYVIQFKVPNAEQGKIYMLAANDDMYIEFNADL